MTDRERIMERLIEDELLRLDRGRQSLWPLRVLESGFQGFSNRPDPELLSALRCHGPKAEFDNPVLPEDEPDDEEEDDDDEDGELHAMPGKIARSEEETVFGSN